MYGFQRFSASAVDPFDLVPNVPIAVLLRQIGWRTVGCTPELGRQLEPLLDRPCPRQLTDLNVQPAKTLVHLQVLDPKVTARLPVRAHAATSSYQPLSFPSYRLVADPNDTPTAI